MRVCETVREQRVCHCSAGCQNAGVSCDGNPNICIAQAVQTTTTTAGSALTTTTTTSTTTTTTTTPEELFTYSNFSCDDKTKICSMNYVNNAGKKLRIVLLFLKNNVFSVYSTDTLPAGSGTFTAFPFRCNGLQAGQYAIMFLVYRNSDTSYSNPIYTSSERKTITCP